MTLLLGYLSHSGLRNGYAERVYMWLFRAYDHLDDRNSQSFMDSAQPTLFAYGEGQSSTVRFHRICAIPQPLLKHS
jgi:hypothetical protein